MARSDGGGITSARPIDRKPVQAAAGRRLECPDVTGLPSVAVLGLDAASAAATIALVDGGLAVTVVTPAPTAPDALAALAAYGCADRIVEVAADTLRLTPAAPPFAIHGTRTTAVAASTSTFPDRSDEPDEPAAGETLGSFDAVVLTDGTRGLLAGAADSPRFGGVFDLATPWVFHVGDAPELAGAQGRWIGEYLRGRYAPPEPAAMGAARSAPARGLPWRGGVRAALIELERELRAGHARAAAGGYPLPTPPVPPAASVPAG